MLDFVRRATLAGIGALTLTEERSRKLVDELVQQGRMSREEGENIVRELAEKAETSRDEWEVRIRDMVQDVFRRMDLVPRADLEVVERQLHALQQRVADLEHKERDREEEIPV